MRITTLLLACLAVSTPAWAQDEIYFPAVENVATRLIDRINAETTRIDMSVSLLTDPGVANAVIARFTAGIPVRLIGDRYSIFDVKFPGRKEQFYRLANAGVPIRVRQNPKTYPELAHWKATIFVGQGLVSFGSANYTTLELGAESGQFSDQTVMFTRDPALVNAFKSEFDRMWSDQQHEISSIVGRPYFANWNDLCAIEPECADYRARFPSPAPMVVNTTRLEGDAPTPPNLIWSQGEAFNSRLVAEIRAESSFIDIVVHRLTVESITNELLAKFAAGVPVRVIIEPSEYRNNDFPEFWLTAANIDRLKVAGIPIKQRAPARPDWTHMKMLVTSTVATNASSNFSSVWQRDHNYFVSAAEKPAIYNAMRERFNEMWADAAFEAFTPLKPNGPSLQEPANGAAAVSTNAALVWARTPFATRYEVLVSRSSNMSGATVIPVAALLVNEPQKSYFARTALSALTTYYWQVKAYTNAGLSEVSGVRSFTTGEAAAVTASPSALDFGAAGGTARIDVTGVGGTPWSASSDVPWLTLSPTSGLGTGVITVTAQPNDSAEARAGRVTVNDAWISVTQAPGVEMPKTGSEFAPRDVSISVTGSRVVISWAAPRQGTAVGYHVEAGLGPGRTDYVLPTTSRSIAVENVPIGVYYVRVRTITPGGPGDASFEVPVGVGVPAAPLDLRVAVSGSNVTLQWTPGTLGDTRPTHFVLEAGFAPGMSDAAVIPVGMNTVVSGTVPSGVYYVRVRAATGARRSAPSNEIVIVVQ